MVIVTLLNPLRLVGAVGLAKIVMYAVRVCVLVCDMVPGVPLACKATVLVPVVGDPTALRYECEMLAKVINPILLVVSPQVQLNTLPVKATLGDVVF